MSSSREVTAARRAARRAAGICVDGCGRKTTRLLGKKKGPHSPRCDECRKKNADRIATLIRRRRAKGLCAGKCGKASKTFLCVFCTPRTERSPASKARRNKVVAKEIAEAKVKGICPVCGDDWPSGTRCPGCLEANRIWAGEHLADRLAQGMCGACGHRALVPGKKKCAICSRKLAKRAKKRRAKKKLEKAAGEAGHGGALVEIIQESGRL